MPQSSTATRTHCRAEMATSTLKCPPGSPERLWSTALLRRALILAGAWPCVCTAHLALFGFRQATFAAARTLLSLVGLADALQAMMRYIAQWAQVVQCKQFARQQEGAMTWRHPPPCAGAVSPLSFGDCAMTPGCPLRT